MRVFIKYQRKYFNISCHKQGKKARIMCEKLGCFAVYYGYADYDKNNLLIRYKLFLRPMDKEQQKRLDVETRTNYPNRALFVVFER